MGNTAMHTNLPPPPPHRDSARGLQGSRQNLQDLHTMKSCRLQLQQQIAELVPIQLVVLITGA